MICAPYWSAHLSMYNQITRLASIPRTLPGIFGSLYTYLHFPFLSSSHYLSNPQPPARPDRRSFLFPRPSDSAWTLPNTSNSDHRGFDSPGIIQSWEAYVYLAIPTECPYSFSPLPASSLCCGVQSLPSFWLAHTEQVSCRSHRSTDWVTSTPSVPLTSTSVVNSYPVPTSTCVLLHCLALATSQSSFY